MEDTGQARFADEHGHENEEGDERWVYISKAAAWTMRLQCGRILKHGPRRIMPPNGEAQNRPVADAKQIPVTESQNGPFAGGADRAHWQRPRIPSELAVREHPSLRHSIGEYRRSARAARNGSDAADL